MSDPIPDTRELMHRALTVPCETKEHLQDWIRSYLGLDLPDCTVDPDSNSNPMDMVWEMYSAMKDNNRPDLRRVMYYASRDSYKTLGAAVVEVLVVTHLDRDVGHMAAIKEQAINSQGYVKDNLGKPFLREYKASDNETRVQVARYEHKETGHNITEKQWNDLKSEADRDMYIRHAREIKIVVCTVRGANGLHTGFLCVDEADIAPHDGYEEAKGIPTERDGKMPITMLISTRKSRFGIVQREIDEAGQTDLAIRHWNIIDVTQACEPERHRPNEPKAVIYANDDMLRHVTENDWKLLPVDQQNKYKRHEAFAGCVKCPIFTACKGNLATRQKSKSKMLRSITYTIGKFKDFSLPAAKAQLLCWKPDTAGLIYPHLDRDVHLITAAAMAEMITGEEHPETFTKSDLIKLAKDRGLEFFAGLDHGSTHRFVVASGIKDGNRMFTFDVQSAAELELEEKIVLMNGTVAQWNPYIYPDTEDPSSNKTLKRKGFKIRDWKKTPGSVIGGIETVRSMLRPAIGAPRAYFLKDDPGCEFLVSKMEKYNWLKDAAGRLTDQPNKEDDDDCDAYRYKMMNVFGIKGRPVVANETETEQVGPLIPTPTEQTYFQQMMQQITGEDPTINSGPSQGSEGGFIWSMD